MEIIPVNKFIKEFKSSGSLTDQIPTDSIYRDMPWLTLGSRGNVSKREVNIQIEPQPGGVCLENFPLFDSEDLAFFNSQSKKYPYVDLGCIVVTIKALFRKNAGVNGRIVLIDDMFDNFHQAKLASFEFSLDSGFAAFAVFPGYSIATTDMVRQRLRAIVQFTDLNVKEGGYQPIAVSVGCVTRISATAFPPKIECLENSSDIFQVIQNSKYLDLEGIAAKEDELRKAFEVPHRNPILITPGGSSKRERKTLLRKIPATKVANLKTERENKRALPRRSMSFSSIPRFVHKRSSSEGGSEKGSCSSEPWVDHEIGGVASSIENLGLRELPVVRGKMRVDD
uniref:Movement protein n=1 Tax=Agapanthus virus A TaxID=2838150 RepID=A0A8E7KNF3_9VIRU|nr:movement protein [Agapanthus virus A]QVY19269.1 movement protein [Agapanthus virus A]